MIARVAGTTEEQPTTPARDMPIRHLNQGQTAARLCWVNLGNSNFFVKKKRRNRLILRATGRAAPHH
jgi:hypothetical protein